MPYDSYPFELEPLPYKYDAMEPYIDSETMYYHHDKHYRTYIDNLNAALEPHPNLQELTLEQLLTWTRFLPQDTYTKIMQNGGGVYNHSLFFKCLAPPEEEERTPSGTLLADIIETYGSFTGFKRAFYTEALKVFGSGWTYLVYTRQGKLKIINLKNQETPLQLKARPVLAVDVWEHAYYLKYKSARSEYLHALWELLTYPVK